MGKFKFFEKNDCFIEYKWAFGGDFLENLFKEQYKRLLPKIDGGIYHIVFMDNKFYSLDFKECKKMLENDGKKAFRDETKDKIIDAIVNKLADNNIEYAVNNGKFITLKHHGYIFKIEVIKKTSLPK